MKAFLIIAALISSNAFAYVEGKWKTDYIHNYGQDTVTIEGDQATVHHDPNTCALGKTGLPTICTQMYSKPVTGKLVYVDDGIIGVPERAQLFSVEGTLYALYFPEFQNPSHVRIFKYNDNGDVIFAATMWSVPQTSSSK